MLGFAGIVQSGNRGTPLLLDTYSGAAAAYSLRKLRTAYTGSAVRVRRSSDSTEQDIGFSNGNLDETSLLSFCGSGSGFVTKWYDQSGNARDAAQSTAANQPRLVNAGVVEKQGGKATLYFDGINDSLSTSTTITIKTQITLNIVVKTIDSAKQFFTEHNSTNTFTTQNGFLFYGTNAAMWIFGRSALHYGWGDSNWLGTNFSLLTLFYSTKGNVYKNNSLVNDGAITGSTLSNSDYTDYLFICSRAGTSFFSNVNLSEYILYSTDKSSSRTAIESNINTYYNIYTP